jgi:hypothetical protein
MRESREELERDIGIHLLEPVAISKRSPGEMILGFGMVADLSLFVPEREQEC